MATPSEHHTSIPKRADRMARSERALRRKAVSAAHKRASQRYARMTVAELEALDYDELQDALLHREYPYPDEKED